MPIAPRALTSRIERYLATDRVVAIMGARQAGKTTLVRRLLNTDKPTTYLNLKDPEVRDTLAANARREFQQAKQSLIILDEVQRLPDILELVQVLVDDNPGRNGQFLLLGSNHLLLNKHIKESLAGRVTLCQLDPLSLAELSGRSGDSFLATLLSAADPREAEEALGQFHVPTIESMEFADSLSGLDLYGGYPEFLTRTVPEDRERWFRDYRQTYLDVDLRQIAQLRNPESFEVFERLFAPRVTSLFNASELARDSRLSADTVRRFTRYYEQLFVAWPLRPYHANFGKRVMKMPKWYFTDTGLLRSIMQDFRPGLGAFFENTVVSEIRKAMALISPETEMHFFRTSAGVEADVVIPNKNKSMVLFLEIKQTKNPTQADIRHLRKLVALPESAIGLLVNQSLSIVHMAPSIWSVPAHWLLA